MLPPARRRGPAAWAAWWCMLLLLAALAAPEALVDSLHACAYTSVWASVCSAGGNLTRPRVAG
jgi:hypothetical protein